MLTPARIRCSIRLEIRRVQRAAFSELEAAALLGGNACAVFGLADA
jgi:hypothetical protein